METQRHEEARARKNDEIDRRNLQQRTTKNNTVGTEKKLIARLFAKDFLKSFKQNTLRIMVDLGTLRKPVDLSIGSYYVPQLYGQIQHDMRQHNSCLVEMDEMINDSMKNLAKSHKAAITKERTRREELEK
jgi:hypothetical protein